VKPALLYSMVGAGALVLFGGSFLGFAILSGTPLHEIAVVKNFVAAPPEAEGHGDAKDDHGDAKTGSSSTDTASETAHAPSNSSEPHSTSSATSDEHDPHTSDSSHGAPRNETRSSARLASASTASILPSFVMPAPFSASELAELQSELHEKRGEFERRLRKVDERERELADWEHAIDGKLADLERLKALLEKKEKELGLREQEVGRDEKARTAAEAKGWRDISQFFVDGEPDELAKKLLSYEPVDAARILRELDEKRASEIVNALPTEKYKSYLEAYRTLPKGQ
jgi:hypothetical protein